MLTIGVPQREPENVLWCSPCPMVHVILFDQHKAEEPQLSHTIKQGTPLHGSAISSVIGQILGLVPLKQGKWKGKKKRKVYMYVFHYI